MFGISYLKLGIGLGVAFLIGLAAFAIRSGLNKIEQQGAEIAKLQVALKGEKAGRERDVAGLTTVSEGIIAASSARSLDEKTLSETIDAKNPQPVSPGLARFLDGLRASDAAAATPRAAAAPHPAAAAGAVRPGR